MLKEIGSVGKIADLHTHNCAGSYDSKATPSSMINSAREFGLSAIALTNHDHYQNIQDINKNPIVCLPGIELTFKSAHKILGLIVKEVHNAHLLVIGLPEKEGTELNQIISRNKNGENEKKLWEFLFDISSITAIIAAHPALNDNMSITPNEIDNIKRLLSGIEVLNGDRQTSKREIIASKRSFVDALIYYCKLLKLSPVGGSDAHKPSCIGQAATVIYDNPQSVEDFVKAIKEGACSPVIIPREYNKHLAMKSV